MDKTAETVRAEHTPTPWKVDPETGFVCTDAQNIAEMIPDTVSDAEIAANARHIVLCVNAHADLLAACEAVDARFGYLVNLWGDEGVTRRVRDQLQAAIAKAKGGA